MNECFGEEVLDIFPTERGGRIFVAGVSGSGKSQLVTMIIKKYSHKLYKVLICGTSHHPIQDLPELRNKVIVNKNITDPELENDLYTKENKGLLVMYDDHFLQAANDETVANVFTKGRHLRVSAILISQNVFMQGKYARTISLNCNHFLLLEQRDLGKIEILGRQLFGREKAKTFFKCV